LRESKIERRCVEIAKAEGWVSIKLQGPTDGGKPDRLFLRDGTLFFVEFKRPGEDLAPLQMWWRRLIIRHKFKHFRIDSIPDFKKVLADLGDSNG
jgi:hypothetical protein